MNIPMEETEAKFYIAHLAALEAQLRSLGAHCLQERTYELNLRFDTPQGDLRRSGRVLRLRRDRQVLLTYKEGREVKEGIHRRTEIEFSVDDFEAARRFLEALGYQVQFIYEKYRTVYLLGGLHLMLDELPYGDFLEIEGEAERIRPLAEKLGLDWEQAIPLSYHALFERLRQRLGLPFSDLLFEHFQSLTVTPEQLGVK